jgi:hypothetical protein
MHMLASGNVSGGYSDNYAKLSNGFACRNWPQSNLVTARYGLNSQDITLTEIFAGRDIPQRNCQWIAII